MAKFPLILPSDPSFYELPPPPGAESKPSFGEMLADAASPEAGEAEAREDIEEASLPQRPLLAGSCDAHVQVIGDPARFPRRDSVSAGDLVADADAYLSVRRRLGLERAVMVQADAYGFDNACLLDALQRLPGDIETVRGVASVAPSVSEGELRDLVAAGCVAARFQMRDPWRLLDWAETDRLAGRVHDAVGWHVELQMEGKFLHEVEPRLRSWPGRVVVEHVGCFLGTVGDKEPGLRALLRLIDADKAWVKLSGPEMTSNERPRSRRQAPGERLRYRDVERIARQLIRFAPERLVWGSNWPHAGAGDQVPDDLWLFDLLGEWTEDEGLRRRILVDNAAALYGFPAPVAPKATAAAPSDGAR